jgi:hypothetical protein
MARRRRWWIVAAILLAILLLAAVVVLAAKWPFSEAKVVHDLEHASGGRAHFTSFHKTFFPPGCISEGVVIRSAHDGPVISIERLEIHGSYSGMLRHYVPLIVAKGARIQLPALGGKSSGLSPKHSDTHIGKLVADQSILEIASAEKNGQPSRFAIHQFAIWDLGSGKAMPFAASLTNTIPPGEIGARGNVGPWATGNLAQTPVSGAYTFRRADLSAIGGISGTLASDGRFSGSVRNLQVDGSVDVPDFNVRRNTHHVHVTSQFRALVNGTNGDVTLQSARSEFGETTVEASGKIAATAGDGKSATLALAIPHGRLQDVLLLFIHAPRAPMTGVASLRARVTIPPGHEPFLHKLFMEGDFGVGGGQFTNPKTQTSVNKLSAKAEGGSDKDDDDPARVVSDLTGHAVLKNATVSFSDLAFRVPGAKARLHGTYNLENERVNLHGVLMLQEKLSDTTSGIKSVLLKPLEPFLKKNHHGGAKLAASITGTYSHAKCEAHPLGK